MFRRVAHRFLSKLRGGRGFLFICPDAAGVTEVQRENQRKICFPGVCQAPSSSRTFGIITARRRSCRSRGSRPSRICSCSPWPPVALPAHLRPKYLHRPRRPAPRDHLCRPIQVTSLPRPRRHGMFVRTGGLCRRGSPTMEWCVVHAVLVGLDGGTRFVLPPTTSSLASHLTPSKPIQAYPSPSHPISSHLTPTQLHSPGALVPGGPSAGGGRRDRPVPPLEWHV